MLAGQMPDLPRYRPSGRASLLIVPVGIGAIALGIALAWPYQALVSWVPYIY